ncbi:MAG: hypothetical protein KKC30_15775 [Proteobacteria bacterium]|nr:hypothetical protein [Pseudomonadota bacterium]MBU4381592.1 hypothetical protein [Pseudomonadota bacterium]MCG2766578.1 hypothetical protein [Desulfarculaceae bacterium]
MNLLAFIPLAQWPKYSTPDLLAMGLSLLALGGAAWLGGRRERKGKP